jgi:MFS family permease
MCARAIVRDLYAPAQGASVMSKGLSGLGVIACLSAPTGGLLTAWFSWHAALLALSVFGAVTLGLIALRFEETLHHKNHHATAPGYVDPNLVGDSAQPDISGVHDAHDGRVLRTLHLSWQPRPLYLSVCSGSAPPNTGW